MKQRQRHGLAEVQHAACRASSVPTTYGWSIGSAPAAARSRLPNRPSWPRLRPLSVRGRGDRLVDEAEAASSRRRRRSRARRRRCGSARRCAPGRRTAASSCSAAAHSAARAGSERSMSSAGCSSSRSCARTTAIGRPTSPATCSLPSDANVSTVHSVVSIARSSADSADSDGAESAATRRGAPASAATSPAANQPSGCCAGVEAVARPGVGRALAARRRSPTSRRRSTGSCSSSPSGRAVDAEHLEALVEVVGQQEAGDRVDLQRRLDLVDARLGCPRRRPASPRRRGGTASAPAAAAAAAARARRARRRASRASATATPSTGTSSVRPKASSRRARVERDGAGRRAASGGAIGCRVRDRRRRRAGGAAPSVAGSPSSWCANAVERGGDDVEVRRPPSASVAERALGGLRRLAAAGRVARVLGLEPVVDGVVQRRGRARGEQRAAAAAPACRRRWPVAVRSRSIGAEAPAVERRRVEAVDVDLPLQPQRHPRLGPGRDADEVGVGALVQREAAQLVGDQPLRLRTPGRRLRGGGPPAPRRRRRGAAATPGRAPGRAVVGAVAAEAQHRLGLQPAEHDRVASAPSRGSPRAAIHASWYGSWSSASRASVSTSAGPRRCRASG